MSTRIPCALAVVACLVLAGGLYAGQAGTTAFPPTVRGSSQQGSTPLGPLAITSSNDVGVSAILPTSDIYIPYGDTFYPRCEVKNYGTQTQTHIPVSCVIHRSTGVTVFAQTVFVDSLGAGDVDTVAFPLYVPPGQDMVYYDTMATALPGDEDTSNDWKAGRIMVSEWGLGHLTYNDGTFEDAIGWIVAGSELTERFVAPERPLSLSKVVLWASSQTGDDYDAEVRVYGNDGTGGCPGTLLGAWTGQIETDIYRLCRRNEICFDSSIVVDYDTFFVSYYNTSIDPHYPYVALDTTVGTIDIGNDWGRFAGTGGGNWAIFYFDSIYDYGIDAYYDALLLDGSVKEITAPQANIDSNTTFTPQVVVKNAGVCDRANIAAEFIITNSADGGDTVYAATANSGPIQAGETKVVTFGQSITPEPGYYTMTSITLLPYDGRPHNDTLSKSLAVGRLGVEDEKTGSARVAVAIAPNPLGRTATVRYSLPKAGLVTFNVYDAAGRGVLSQTITAGRTGAVNLDLRELEAGVYIVKVRADGFSKTQKLVVQHQ